MDIITEQQNAVLIIRINRPAKKNALTTSMYQQLVEALIAAEENKTVRAILIQGTDGIFCAGNDLEDFVKQPNFDENSSVIRFLFTISQIKKPIVAAVSGPAVGIGTTMLLHCDLIYAADTTIFALPFTSLGLCPEAASSLLLPRISGYALAAEKLLLGEPFSASEAFRMGIINRIIPSSNIGGDIDVNVFALKQAQKLTTLPEASLQITKALLKENSNESVPERIKREAQHFAVLLKAPASQEAFSAFFEKRKADFSKF